MKSGFKKRHRNRFPPRWAGGYPFFAWLGLGTSLGIYGVYRKVQDRREPSVVRRSRRPEPSVSQSRSKQPANPS
jgi:hypothetical protein